MLPNFTYPADIFPSSRFYRQDLADPPIELVRTARVGLACSLLRACRSPTPRGWRR